MKSVSPQSPEERRKRLAELKAKFGSEVADKFRPTTTPWIVTKRVAVGVSSDGFIHAGNLAYLAVLALFPFFILAAAVAHLLGQGQDAILTVNNVLQRLPPNVADLMRDPIREVLTERTGPLLWFGGFVGLWTAASFVETIRDILRRSYGVQYSAPFWSYRLGSVALIMGAVLLMMIALGASVVLASLNQAVVTWFPFASGLASKLGFYRLAPAVTLYGTFYFLFLALTPSRYRKKSCRKWPGALFVTVWWLVVVELLPRIVAWFGGYQQTYGSLAGVMVALIFFFFAGLGVTIAAELNAALADAGGKALRGEVYSGPFSDELEVEEPQPGEDMAPELVSVKTVGARLKGSEV
ncbi:YihY/virulence factor BrkB family protein [Sphingomonas sp.]|uniref:YihY/virulence factor BrkB family protein n=1 Tax=Sphingomonas sp. TaxID=28214 RepID=UPI003751A8F3